MPDYAALTWDGTGKRYYHSGVSKGVLYRLDANNAYSTGVAWNGLTGVEEKPDGADTTDLWADNMKYASFRSSENYKGTISAYTWPDEFDECNGCVAARNGMLIGQQSRKPFGMCYRTEVGSDTNPEAGYILHIVYGATVSPSSKNHETISDNPDAAEMSWDFECVPATVNNITGVKQCATIDLDSRVITSAKMTAIENILYGSNSANARLPMPDEIYSELGT